MENNFRKRNLIVKKYFLFFIFSCFSFFINAEQMKETFWGIPFGSDFSIVNDKMISKGFYLDEKTEKSSDILQYVYRNRTGKFAETKPSFILIVFSETKGMTAASIAWQAIAPIMQNESLRDSIVNIGKNDPVKANYLMASNNKQYFSTLINSLNKKYGVNINHPDMLQDFSYEVLNSKDLYISFGLHNVITGADSFYMLQYISSLYEEVVNDDV